jgi:hypothetical protein
VGLPEEGDEAARHVRDPTLGEPERSNEDRLIGRMAVPKGIISDRDLQTCFRQQDEARANGKTLQLGVLLISRGLLTTEN